MFGETSDIILLNNTAIPFSPLKIPPWVLCERRILMFAHKGLVPGNQAQSGSMLVR